MESRDFDFKHFLKNYPRKLIQHKMFFFFNKSFCIMNSNHIFPITDLPRGLGLNFFSLVYLLPSYTIKYLFLFLKEGDTWLALYFGNRNDFTLHSLCLIKEE